MSIFKSTVDFLNSIKDEYPNVKLVSVAMGNTVHSVYSDDTYTTKIGELQYCYSIGTSSMFGYDYKFIKEKKSEININNSKQY